MTAQTFTIRTRSTAPYLIAWIKAGPADELIGYGTEGYAHVAGRMFARLRRLNARATVRPEYVYRYAAAPIVDGTAVFGPDVITGRRTVAGLADRA
jgi:hypothetical protein